MFRNENGETFIIAGKFQKEVNPTLLREYILGLAKSLDLVTEDEVEIFTPLDLHKTLTQEYEASIKLRNGGLSLHIFGADQEFDLLIFTSEYYDKNLAIKFTADYLHTIQVEVIEEKVQKTFH
jgi:hypothetical protein